MGNVIVNYRHVIKREHNCFVVLETPSIDTLLAALGDMVRHGMPRDSLVEFNRRADVSLTANRSIEAYYEKTGRVPPEPIAPRGANGVKQRKQT